jgi:radical SAM protein with 4Fe4S-binding SPASM domain
MKISYIIKEVKYYNRLEGLHRAVRKFLLTQTPLRKLVNSPAYIRLYSKIIKRKTKIIEPKNLQIENTNLCNAKCIMCPHVIMKRKGKIMNFENFKKIVDNVLRNYNIKRLTITGFGEPIIDKGIIKKIKYVNEKYPNLKIDIFTNASVLSKEMSESLLKTKIDRITFSINGTEKNYKKIMDLDYEKTKNNVIYFIEKNKEYNKKVLTNVSLMILEENKEDIENFIEFWKLLADSVRVYPPSDWAGNVKINYITKNPFKKKRWSCRALWSFITVDVDGNVIMCCRDYESKVKFGNLIKRDAKEVFEGPEIKKVRENHLDGKYSMPICSICDNSFDTSLDWWD